MSARRNVFEIFWPETCKNDDSTRGRGGMRLQVPACPQVNVPFYFPKMSFYFPELPFYFQEIPFCFLELPFCFPKVSFCFSEVSFYFSKGAVCFPELIFPEVPSFYFLCVSFSMSAFFQLI